MAENINDCGGKGCKRLWAFVILAAGVALGGFFRGIITTRPGCVTIS